MTKYYLITYLLICTNFAFGQLIFSTSEKKPSSKSVLLEFDNEPSNVKGLILPSVKNLELPASDGTILYDANEFNFKVKITNTWKNLTDSNSDAKINLELNDSKETVKSGIIIGNDTEEVNGILVLSAKDKAMILPKIKDPEINVLSPYAGMICFDTNSHMLALFNGTEWYYYE